MATKWSVGIFKGRAVAGSAKWGRSTGGHRQIGLVVKVAQGRSAPREGIVYLIFSPDSQEYAMDRLRALGWQGNDISDLRGIDRNYVDIDVSYRSQLVSEEMGPDGKVVPATTREMLSLEIVMPARVQMKTELTSKELDAFRKEMESLAAKAPEVTLPIPDGVRKANGTPAKPEPRAADGEDYEHPDDGP